MRKYKLYQFIILSIFSGLLLSACKKDKLDNNAGLEPVKTGDTVAATPVNPTIRIRIVNRMEQLPRKLEDVRYRDTLENLYGPVTLVYADGTPVSAQTTNVGVNSASPYIEIPYGTYQFKLLTVNGRQIPADEFGTSYNKFDPATSLMFSNNFSEPLSALTYAPVLSYQPGGTYTLIVRPNVFHVPVNSIPEAQGQQNQFLVVADEPIKANSQYARVQAVNAYSAGQVTFHVAGSSLSLKTDYGKASDYTTVSIGNCSVEAVDASGKVLARTETMLTGGQNVSFYLWPDKSGSAKLLPVYNDLSSAYFLFKNGENGQLNVKKGDMLPTAIRFLNLSGEEPYVSFTVGNGEDARKSIMYKDSENVYEAPGDNVLYNLEPGVAIINFPYTRWNPEYNRAFDFRVFRSKPGVIPGNWAQDVAVLPGAAFVARPTLYNRPGQPEARIEPGIYTVALIGRRIGSEKTKMIIVKHNQ